MNARRVLLRAAALAVAWCCTACDGGSAPMPAEPITVQLEIVGMHCGGCVEAISVEAREVDGLDSIDVSLERNSARLRVRDEPAAAEVVRAIESLGYRVTRIPAHDAAASPPPTPAVGR